uniref:Uncharacterized protein n=1 Tax=Cyprinus carpio TaxID=7962 RepID=A0A8C1ZD74_CYPCA
MIFHLHFLMLCPPQQNKPLNFFEDNADYVYDVMWSPVHPSLFAAVDGMGRLDLWNLNDDTEVPTASVTIEGSPALNCVRWASWGKEVTVGDSEGRVWICRWRGMNLFSLISIVMCEITVIILLSDLFSAVWQLYEHHQPSKAWMQNESGSEIESLRV